MKCHNYKSFHAVLQRNRVSLLLRLCGVWSHVVTMESLSRWSEQIQFTLALLAQRGVAMRECLRRKSRRAIPLDRLCHRRRRLQTLPPTLGVSHLVAQQNPWGYIQIVLAGSLQCEPNTKLE